MGAEPRTRPLQNPQLLSSLSHQRQNLMTFTSFSHSSGPLSTAIPGCASSPASLPLVLAPSSHSTRLPCAEEGTLNLASKCLGFNPLSFFYQLCGFEQLTYLL